MRRLFESHGAWRLFFWVKNCYAAHISINIAREYEVAFDANEDALVLLKEEGWLRDTKKILKVIE